ncbi:MAG: hypothetical protein H7X91_07985 [Burkholderiales bacterium]|nr:hypothetical protein [Burkholderiales bacterium]
MIQTGGGDDVVDLTSENYDYGNVSIDGGAGKDVLWSGSGNDLVIGGGGSDELFGGYGADLLIGGLDNDRLEGDGDVDILQGGDGNDTLIDGLSNNVFDGGAGKDDLTGGAGNELFIGGTGNDIIGTGLGADIIAVNRGGGRDIVSGSADPGDTLSLGGGIGYEDLFLSKRGKDLVFDLGNGDRITFDDWYASSSKSVVNLQVVAESMAAFDSAGSDPLKDDKLEQFDFAGLVERFDQSRVVSDWAVSNALLDFHLGGSDTEALGGDLAYQYGRNGSLAGIGSQAAQAIIAQPQFGVGAQSLQPLASLQQGTVKLA